MVNGSSYLKSFSGAKVRHLDHFTEVTLSENNPDIAIFHIRFNGITHRNVEDINNSKIVDEVISIGKKCAIFGVKNVEISSIFLKRQLKSTKVIR